MEKMESIGDNPPTPHDLNQRPYATVLFLEKPLALEKQNHVACSGSSFSSPHRHTVAGAGTGQTLRIALPSVWVVFTYDAEGIKQGQGSAVVIDKEQLVTNCHVLSKAKTFNIKRENTTHAGRLLHLDIERDLCIIEAKGLKAPAVETLPVKSIRIGQKAYALGTPKGFELTFSDGLVPSLLKDENGNLLALCSFWPHFSAPVRRLIFHRQKAPQPALLSAAKTSF